MNKILLQHELDQCNEIQVSKKMKIDNMHKIDPDAASAATTEISLSFSSSSRHLICFSLFHSDGWQHRFYEYMLGALANIQARDLYFPQYILRFYVQDQLKQHPIVEYMVKQPGVQMIFKEFENCVAAVEWRYIPLFEHDQTTQVILIRDCDSVLTQNDARTVQSWLDSPDTAPVLLYREYLMTYCACGGGVSVNLSKFRSMYANFNLVKFSQSLVEKPPEFPVHIPFHTDRGYDEFRLHQLFAPLKEKGLTQEIQIRMDCLGRYYFFKETSNNSCFQFAPVVLLESITMIVDYNDEDKSWLSSKGTELLIAITLSPETFLIPAPAQFQLIQQHFFNYGFKWNR
jgi:hypothetical protein